MLSLFLTEAAIGSLLVLLAVPPRATGRLFFRYAVAQSCFLVILGTALSATTDRYGRLSFTLFGLCVLALLVSAGLFHRGRLGAGQTLMILGLIAGLGGVVRDALTLVPPGSTAAASFLVYPLDALTSGLVTGSVLMAMILGHFYLNIPDLSVTYLQRLALIAMGAIVGRALLLTVTVSMHRAAIGPLMKVLLDVESGPLPAGGLDPFVIVLIILQIVCGVLAPVAFAFMAWRSAKISATQSATGILYVALVVVIMGELAGRYIVTMTRLPL